MTQAENIKRFKWVQAEAKKLKAKNKKLTHIEAVKQAWAIWYKKHPAKTTSKKIGAIKKKAAKKAAPKKKAAKKAAPKKTATKKACAHKDTNSHNVRVSVVSGIEKIPNKILDELNSILNKIRVHEEMRDKFKTGIKFKKYDKENTIKARNNIKKANEYIKSLKANFRELKKHLK